MSMPDRPARPARGKLTPPANANVDPIDAQPTISKSEPTSTAPAFASTPEEGKGAVAPAAAAPAPGTAATASAPTVTLPDLDVTVQSGIRWSPDTEAIVRAAKTRTGKTRRAIVEEAIAAMWAS
jgi:hypothetical protein